MRVLIVATLLGSVGWPALLTPTSDMDNASPYNTSAGGDTYAPGDGLKLGTHPKIILLFWFSSLILAQAGLLLLLLTFSLSKSITPRDPALVNLTVISFIGTFIYLILFYDGSWMEHLPPFAPCLTQTVLKHSFDIAYLVAVLILIFETWRSLLRLGNDSTTRVRGIRLYLIIALPYLSAVCVGVPVVVRATHHPTDIVRDDWSFYCTLNNPDIGKVIQGAQIVLVVLALIFQGLIIRLIFNYRAQHQLLSTQMMDLSRALRVSMFIALEVILILFSSGLFEKWPVLRAGVLALAPALMFVVFATQTDLFRVWFPCWLSNADEEKAMHLLSASQNESSDARRSRKANRTSKELSPIIFVPGDHSVSESSSQ